MNAQRRPVRIAAALAALTLLAAVLPGTGCASRRKQAASGIVDARTLHRRAERHLYRRNLHRARQLLERVRYTAEDRADLEPLIRLMLADVAFYQGTDMALIDARALYQDFVTLYADHARAPYAQLQAGVCSLEQANDPARDQSETLQAIVDLRSVLARFPDSPYARVAREKIEDAHNNLAEHEYGVGRFYLKKKKYAAAVARFKRIVDEYPAYPEREKLYLNLGRALMLSGSEVEGRLYLEKLLDGNPDRSRDREARRLLASAGSPE